MHRHDAALRQDEVQQTEDGLLHFTRVGRSADQDQLLREIDRDHRLAAAAVPFGIRAEARQVDDRIFGLEAGELTRFRTNEQGPDEEIMPGELIDDADPDTMLGLRSAIEISDVKLILV